MHLPVPRWFPPLSRNHPGFFVAYSFTIFLNLGLAAVSIFGSPGAFDRPPLTYVGMIAGYAWGGVALVVDALLLLGFKPGWFQWGRAGFAIGFFLWFARAWLIVLYMLVEGGEYSWLGPVAYSYIALTHISQGIEPPLNPSSASDRR